MTLIVGIKCKDAVVLAADSQISYGHSSLRTDIQKIEQVDFANMPVLVALADHVSNAGKFIDKFRKSASKLSPQTIEEIGSISQSVMTELRQEIRAKYDNCRAPKLDKIIAEKSLNCSMTIAAYINNESHLIKIDLMDCSYDRSRALYETDGCGASLADYILKEYHQPNENFELTALLAAYTVWRVTKHDRYCRQPLVMGAVMRPGGILKHEYPRARMFSSGRVNGLIQIGKQIEGATRETRNAVIRNAFAVRAAEEMKWASEMMLPYPLTRQAVEEMMGNPDAPESAEP